MTVSRRTTLLGLLGLAMALAVPAAIARRRAGFRMRGLPNGARHKGPVLTREQLRQCVKEQNAINAGSDQVDRLQTSVGTDEVRINRLEAEISAREPLVDRYSQESVDSFNALIDEHKRLVAAYNSRLPSVNARVEQTNAAVQQFNAKCADRVYYESDMQAVVAGK